MTSKDLLQMLADKIEIDNQFRHSPILVSLHSEGKADCATVAIEIEGKMKIIEICAKDWGLADALVIGA